MKRKSTEKRQLGLFLQTTERDHKSPPSVFSSQRKDHMGYNRESIYSPLLKYRQPGKIDTSHGILVNFKNTI